MLTDQSLGNGINRVILSLILFITDSPGTTPTLSTNSEVALSHQMELLGL